MANAITRLSRIRLNPVVTIRLVTSSAIDVVHRVGRTLPRGVLCMALCATLAACSTLNSTPSVTVAADSSFVMLPFDNLSITPKADVSMRQMVETRLRQSGVHRIQLYSVSEPASLKALLDTRLQVDEAVARATASGARYGVKGTVHEWQYNNGADREPVVGITLSLIDLASGNVLWQANAARSGWGSANLSATADRTIADLLSQLKFSGTQARLDSGEQ